MKWKKNDAFWHWYWKRKQVPLNFFNFHALKPVCPKTKHQWRDFKVWSIKNNTNLNSIFCLVKSSKIGFFFSPAFYLIMWLMTLQKNFEKIAILKIWELFSFELSKLTSVRKKLNLSLKYWFMEAKFVFWMCYGPQK